MNKYNKSRLSALNLYSAGLINWAVCESWILTADHSEAIEINEGISK